ncbi:MAG: hypothetical protein NT001_04410 [Candidatus Woesearchaeota archaeon]|nr:hypothetical protein [Candidatus Woesearchaeota archaeon]
MAGGNTQESHCELGFDESRFFKDLTLIELLELYGQGKGVPAAKDIVTLELTVNGVKRLYCKGHTCITEETLPEFDPDYKQRGTSINDEGFMVNLHGNPVCWGCTYRKPKE